MALTECRSAILCALVAFMAWPNYAVRIYALGGAAWFLGQGIDEWTLHNLWKDGTWEYPWFVAVGFFLYLHVRFHDRARAKGQPDQVDH